MKAWRQANAASLKEKKKAYAVVYQQRPEVKERSNQRNREWRAKNPDWARERERLRRQQSKYRVFNAENQRRRKAAMPAWADANLIRAFYEEAERLTRETGAPHHVDHIVPITNPLVCGLHVQFNLRAVTAAENLRKRNKFMEI